MNGTVNTNYSLFSGNPHINTDSKTSLGKQGQKVFLSTCASGKAIGDMSSALGFMKVWRQNQILSQIHAIPGIELRQSPIQVLK